MKGFFPFLEHLDDGVMLTNRQNLVWTKRRINWLDTQFHHEKHVSVQLYVSDVTVVVCVLSVVWYVCSVVWSLEWCVCVCVLCAPVCVFRGVECWRVGIVWCVGLLEAR